MEIEWPEGLRQDLLRKKAELNARLERITANLRRGLESDSKERAKQLEDSDVVDALGNEARVELVRISDTLKRMQSGEFGICDECGTGISIDRLRAYPYAVECIDCARLDEHPRNWI
jgi:RNA polymerase-binding protein DksA